ncbi:MAG: hypothetical protein QG673_2122 [Pseudomonadota bacterium]|nr:hypothetical protein [Pseudomonadota bacterium]
MLKVNCALIFYLIAVSIGGLTIISTNWNALQIFVGVSFISLITYTLINIRHIRLCLNTVRQSPLLAIKLSIGLALMFLPIFYTQKHGVSTVYYNLTFAIILALLGFIASKKYLSGFMLAGLMLGLLVWYKFEFYHCLAIIGPAGGYYMLTISRQIASNSKLSTLQLMCVRYIVLTLLCSMLLPWLDFKPAMFEMAEITKILSIAIFMNIIPIYCSQYVALTASPSFMGKGTSLLPLTTLIISHVFYKLPISGFEIIYSLLIASPLIINWLRARIVFRKTLNYKLNQVC